MAILLLPFNIKIDGINKNKRIKISYPFNLGNEFFKRILSCQAQSDTITT
jgi:hypothetical protein